MLRTYIGIATATGLECLLPEDETTLAFVTTQTYTDRTAISFWVTVSEDVVTQVRKLLASGDGPEALRLLDSTVIQSSALSFRSDHIPRFEAGIPF